MMSNPPEPTSDLEVQLSTAMQNCLERKEHVVGVPGQPCVPADAVALLEKGVDPNTLTHVRTHTFGYYLMHLAAGSAFEHSETLLAALIEAGGDVNIVATKGDRRTPLYVAAVNGQVSKARMLLEAGAVVDKGDKLLTSPLFIAAQDGHVPMVELLLQHGAEARKPTKEGWYALNVAASECLELRNDRKVCEHGAPGERLCKHLHPIEVGVAAFAKVVQMLLEAGADPLQQDVEGSPALHYAVWCDSPDMIRSLLRHGADVNKPSLTGEPPLWVAAKRGDMEMVELFLSEGADPIQPTHINPANEVGGAALTADGVAAQSTMWFPAEVAAKNGYIEVSNRINQAVKDMSAETASEMGVDYTDIRDTVRPQACNKMMDMYADRAEDIIKQKNQHGWAGSTTNCGGKQLSDAEKLFPIPAASSPPPPPPPPPPPLPAPKPGADLRTAIGKDESGAYYSTSAAAMAAAIETSTNIDTLLQGGEYISELPLDRYPSEAADDKRIAYMRLVLWAAASKAAAVYYGLDPSDGDYLEEHVLLRSRSQQLLGAGDVHVISAFQRLDADGDSRLTMDEITAVSVFLRRIDTDGDGLLSQAELFSDEADAEEGWVTGASSTQGELGSPEPEPEWEPEHAQQGASSDEETVGDGVTTHSEDDADEAEAEAETEEEDAAFIDGLSELTMMMNKAGSLGSLLNQHATVSAGGAGGAGGDTGAAAATAADNDSAVRPDDGAHAGSGGGEELEEELRRMRGLASR